MTPVDNVWLNLPIAGPGREDRIQDSRGTHPDGVRALHLYGEPTAVALNACEYELDFTECRYRLAENVEVYLGLEELEKLAEACKRHAERIRTNLNETKES